MPMELQRLAENRGTVTFSKVKKVPAYVSAVYDSKGEWDGQSGPPPDGSSLGLQQNSRQT